MCKYDPQYDPSGGYPRVKDFCWVFLWFLHAQAGGLNLSRCELPWFQRLIVTNPFLAMLGKISCAASVYTSCVLVSLILNIQFIFHSPVFFLIT